MRRVKNIYILLITLLLLLFTVSAYATEVTLVGKVMKVTDGNTIVIRLTKEKSSFICRLYGIDAPETPQYTSKGTRKKPGQPYGEEATITLKRMILEQTVEVTLIGPKKHNGAICRIEKDGIDVNLEMVRLGYAWAYKQHLKQPHSFYYIGAERDAREQRLGLWQDKNPTPPWEFRRSLRQK